MVPSAVENSNTDPESVGSCFTFAEKVMFCQSQMQKGERCGCFRDSIAGRRTVCKGPGAEVQLGRWEQHRGKSEGTKREAGGPTAGLERGRAPPFLVRWQPLKSQAREGGRAHLKGGGWLWCEARLGGGAGLGGKPQWRQAWQLCPISLPVSSSSSVLHRL